MLPCDPRAKGAIEEVSRASEVRMAALGEVLKVALAQANADSERVRLALAAEDASLRDVETERADSEQARTAIDGQLGELTESANHHEGLEDARKKLTEIAAITARRGSTSRTTNSSFARRSISPCVICWRLAMRVKRRCRMSRRRWPPKDRAGGNITRRVWRGRKPSVPSQVRPKGKKDERRTGLERTGGGSSRVWIWMVLAAAVVGPRRAPTAIAMPTESGG